MSKETGLGANFYLDAIDLSGDTGSMQNISKATNTLPFTGIDKSAHERKAAVLIGRFAWQSFFNPTNAHLKLEDLPRIDVIASYFHRPTLAVPVASMVSKQINYDGKRGADGSYMFDVECLSNAWWLDWGLALTAGKRTDTGATNGTGVNFTSGANFGLQAYLHVFAFTGTSVTVKLQHSNDDGAGDPYADITGGSFTLVTGITQERIATARNLAIKPWIRVVTTGIFNPATFAVSAIINRTDLTI